MSSGDIDRGRPRVYVACEYINCFEYFCVCFVRYGAAIATLAIMMMVAMGVFVV